MGVVLIVGMVIFFSASETRAPVIANFTECVAAGYPVLESYPEQCRTPDGRTFIKEAAEVPNPAAPQTPPPPQNNTGGSGNISSQCVVAGCSGQLCVAKENADIITTCEYRPEYACYKQAKCEPQSSGQCGWTETPTLRACLQSSTSSNTQSVPQ